MSASSQSPPETSRRGLPRWFKVTTITFLVLANLAVLAIFWAISTGQSILSEADTDEDVVAALSAPTGDALTFLVVGSDSREGLDDLQNFGPAGGERGDVVMLVRLDRSSGEAKMLSIPRDLWVDIPGNGMNKINAAYAFGGPALMVDTVEHNLGIPVNHYVEVGFVGFAALVDELGGIRISFPYPARDLSSGLDVQAGDQVLNGDMALAYARSRKYQEYQNGTWVGVEASDIGRTKRQQAVVSAILAELKNPSSITEAGSIASSLARHMTIDASLAEASVASLAWEFRSILSGGLSGVTLPVYGDSVNGASIVRAQEPEASQVIADFLAGSSQAAAPLRLQVLNGNGLAGSAAKMSEQLTAAGFDVASVGDAARKDYAVTTILVPAGSGDGLVILNAIGFGEVTTGDVDNIYDAVVIVGTDAS